MYFCLVQEKQGHNKNKMSQGYPILIPLMVLVLILSPCAVQSNVLSTFNIEYVKGLNKKKCLIQQSETVSSAPNTVKTESFWLGESGVEWIVVTENTVFRNTLVKRQWTIILKRFLRFSQLKIHVKE